MILRPAIAVCLLAVSSLALSDAAPAADEIAEKVLAEDGSWGYNGPHAVYHGGKLLFNYIDSDGIVWAASYDTKTGEIDRGKVWETYADLHQASSILLRPDGRVQLFVNKGGVYTDNTIFWRVSEMPSDVTAFGELQASADVGVPQGRQPYPLIHQETGDVYVVLNVRIGGNRQTALWRSTDGGDTFEEFHRLFILAPDLRSDRSYTRAYIEGDDIHMIALRIGWNESLAGHAIGRSEGVHYIRYNVKDRAFYRADRTRSFRLEDAPVEGPERLDTLWHWQDDGQGQQRAMWADLVAKNGKPYAAIVVQDAAPQGTSVRHEGYWATPDEQGRWQRFHVDRLARGWDNQPERKNYAIAIDPRRPDDVFVAKSTDWERDLSQVHRLRTPDGGKTWQSVETLSREGRVTTVVVPPQLDDTPRVFDVLWMEGRHEGWRNFNTRIVTHPPHNPDRGNHNDQE